MQGSQPSSPKNGFAHHSASTEVDDSPVNDGAVPADDAPVASDALPQTQPADGVRVTAAFIKRGVTAYGLWVNWEASLAGYPQVKPHFHVCVDASFARLQPVCELGVKRFVQRSGRTGGSLNAVKLAHSFTFGGAAFERGTPLSQVRYTWLGVIAGGIAATAAAESSAQSYEW